MKETRHASLDRKQRLRARYLGAAFIVVGVPGLILPILQGFLLILIGLLLLSYTSPRIHGWLVRARNRFRWLERPLKVADRVARRWL